MRRRDRVYPVVGRDRELAVFERAVARAADGQPGVVLVSGDPGIGKSTLLTEAARRTDTQLYVGRCVHVGGDVIPLAPLVDLIRQIEREREDGPLHSLESLSELTTSSAGRKGDVFTLALQLVGELGADGPVLVGFDDLHWGDPATWDLFEHVARNLVDERVVLVGTYRADEVVRDPGMRRRAAELSAVRLAVERRHDRDGRHAAIQVDAYLRALAHGLHEHAILHQDEVAGRPGRVLVFVEGGRGVRRPPRTRERDGNVTGTTRRRDAEAARAAASGARALRVARAACRADGHCRVLREVHDLVGRRASGRVLEEELLPQDKLVGGVGMAGAEQERRGEGGERCAR